MNKKNIVDSLTNSISCSSQTGDIVRAIHEAMDEWENARAYFDIVSEPKLVDYAIYLEAAAKSRYIYLIGEAKEKGIIGDCNNMLEEINSI